MLLISLQAEWCNHHGRNLEYLEGQLEGHRLLQRNKMEIADRQVVQSYAAFFLRYSGHKQTFDVNHCAYVFVTDIVIATCSLSLTSCTSHADSSDLVHVGSQD